MLKYEKVLMFIFHLNNKEIHQGQIFLPRTIMKVMDRKMGGNT